MKNISVSSDIIPEYERFAEIVAKSGIYGPGKNLRDMVDVAVKRLRVKGNNAFFRGIKRIRSVPNMDRTLWDAFIFDMIDYENVTSKIKRLFGRIGDYEKDIGLDDVYPMQFFTSGLSG